jgi:DNA-binding HxlR family transcriptional regulator
METTELERLCPRVESAFALFSKKWNGLIVHVLLAGELYFCDIEKAIPSLSARLLSLRMRELEGEGIVDRHVSSTSPVRVSYSLTDKGRAMAPIVNAIENWAYEWIEEGERG